jgi:putative transposon-encoded protein
VGLGGWLARIAWGDRDIHEVEVRGDGEVVTRRRGRIRNTFPPVKKSGYFKNTAKFEVYGVEMIEKEVRQSGNSGRVYLPPDWIGKHVKIIRMD